MTPTVGRAERRHPDHTLTERGWQRRVVDLAHLRGWRVFHLPDSRGSGLVGWPDLTLIRGQQLHWLELKTATGRVRPAQTDVLAALDQIRATTVRVARPAHWPDLQELLR